MRFAFRELHDLTDAQHNFEQLEGIPILDRRTSSGSATVTFSTSQQATPLVVNHGLGAMPTGVLLTLFGGTFAANISGYVGTITATQFTLNAFSSVSLNQTITFMWLAIG